MAQKWVVEFVVADSWVADGFELTNERAKNMIEEALGWSYGHETAARVIEAPDPNVIEGLQDGSVDFDDQESVTTGK